MQMELKYTAVIVYLDIWLLVLLKLTEHSDLVELTGRRLEEFPSVGKQDTWTS